MEFIFANLFNFSFAVILASLASLFWLYFWYLYSKKYTTPRRFLLKAFISGIAGAILAGFFEIVVLRKILPQDIFLIIGQERTLREINNIMPVFGAVFFLTALPEEIIKFLFLKLFLFRSRYFNQIIDGIKFGIVLGLGFALIENGYFFLVHSITSPLISNLLLFFLFRLFIATLAHSLYGGILGYYFGLARFYKVFKNTFLWQGFISTVIFHAFFNFLILTPLNIFTLLILIATLILLMSWYTSRKNFQLSVIELSSQKAKPPIFVEQREMQALLAEGTKSNFRLVRKLGLCPFCFRKIKEKEGICHYCGQRIFPELQGELGIPKKNSISSLNSNN